MSHKLHLICMKTECFHAKLRNCVNFAWSMESGVWNLIPSLGFTSKNDINNHVFSSLVLNPNVGFESHVWYWQCISKIDLFTFYSWISK